MYTVGKGGKVKGKFLSFGGIVPGQTTSRRK